MIPMNQQTSNVFEWNVVLPQKGEHYSTWKRPQAKLNIHSDGHGDEQLFIPVSVGKSLLKKRKQGEADFSSRAELLCAVRDQSMVCGKKRMADLVNRRDYSEQELKEKLQKDGYQNAVIDELLERARSLRLVDDNRFANTFIHSKLYAGWGEIKIERELTRRGIDVSSLPGWPDEYFEQESEYDRAYALASRKHLSGKNDYQKIVRFLVSRGFSSSTAFSVAKQLLSSLQ